MTVSVTTTVLIGILWCTSLACSHRECGDERIGCCVTVINEGSEMMHATLSDSRAHSRSIEHLHLPTGTELTKHIGTARGEGSFWLNVKDDEGSVRINEEFYYEGGWHMIIRVNGDTISTSQN